MDQKYDNTPEVAPQNFPEVAHTQPYHGTPPPPAQGYQQPYNYYGVPKDNLTGYPDGSTVYSAASPYQGHVQPAPEKKTESLICGCTFVVFCLSCIIGILSAGLIGLAAGTGVEASRANDLSNKVAVLSSSLARGPTPTTVTAIPAATDFNSIDNGCSNDPNGVTNTSYTAFSCTYPEPGFNKLLASVCGKQMASSSSLCA